MLCEPAFLLIFIISPYYHSKGAWHMYRLLLLIQTDFHARKPPFPQTPQHLPNNASIKDPRRPNECSSTLSVHAPIYASEEANAHETNRIMNISGRNSSTQPPCTVAHLSSSSYGSSLLQMRILLLSCVARERAMLPYSTAQT